MDAVVASRSKGDGNVPREEWMVAHGTYENRLIARICCCIGKTSWQFQKKNFNYGINLTTSTTNLGTGAW